MKLQQYLLAKILIARPGRPGFATPLFTCENNDKIYIQMISNDMVSGFEEMPFSSINGYLQDCDLTTSERIRTAGSEPIYAFIEPSDSAIIGYKEVVSRTLRRNFRSYSSYPFLRKQIAMFVNEPELVNFAAFEADRKISSKGKSTGANDKFEIYQDKRGEYRWRRKASNGQIVGASCEGYVAKADATANMFRGPKISDKWEFYQDKRGEYRWRRMASNGQIVGASSEGYVAKADAKANAERQGYISPVVRQTAS